MRYSLRRLLLATAGAAGMFALFRPNLPETILATSAAAIGLAGLILLVNRTNRKSILRVATWTVAGMLLGAVFSAQALPELPEFLVPGALLGGIAGVFCRRPADNDSEERETTDPLDNLVERRLNGLDLQERDEKED